MQRKTKKHHTKAERVPRVVFLLLFDILHFALFCFAALLMPRSANDAENQMT